MFVLVLNGSCDPEPRVVHMTGDDGHTNISKQLAYFWIVACQGTASTPRGLLAVPEGYNHSFGESEIIDET